jgi:hypothetical protein
MIHKNQKIIRISLSDQSEFDKLKEYFGEDSMIKIQKTGQPKIEFLGHQLYKGDKKAGTVGGLVINEKKEVFTIILKKEIKKMLKIKKKIPSILDMELESKMKQSQIQIMMRKTGVMRNLQMITHLETNIINCMVSLLQITKIFYFK